MTDITAEDCHPHVPVSADELKALTSVCKRALSRMHRTIEKQNLEVTEAANAGWYQQAADSLLAHLSDYPRGTSDTVLDNIHTGKLEEVKLNPKFDARENADLLYKKARKLRRGAEIVDKRIEEGLRQVAVLEQILAECERAKSPDTPPEEVPGIIASVTLRLQDLRVLPRTPALTAAGILEPKVPYYHFTVDGFDVYAGRNATQNDELTTRFTRTWDIWMHVVAHSGSHVVIRREKAAPWPPGDVINKVAALAVWFSKAKHTTYAEVHVTEGRFVHKRRKAPAGEVIAERCKTVRVAPKSPQELFLGKEEV